MTSWSRLFDGANDKSDIVIPSAPNGSRIVVVSDSQIPLHDEPLLNTIFNKFVPDYRPTGRRAQYHLFLNGDIIDEFMLSKYPARVVPKFTLEDEIRMTSEALATWRTNFTHGHYGFGNHEDRWDRELFAGNKQLAFATQSLAEALDLSRLGYDWVPYGKKYDFLGFLMAHGDLTIKHTAKAMMELYASSGASGHVNRPHSWTSSSGHEEDAMTWTVTGPTCRLDIGDVIKDWTRRPQGWEQSFLIGEVQDDVLFTNHVRVHHGKFFAANKVYTIA